MDNVKSTLKLLSQRGALLALIILIIAMGILTGGNFLSPTNLINILMQITVICIIAIGMTFVILTGGIDLSVGAVVAFSGLIMAIGMKVWNLPVPVSIFLGMLLAAGVGLINGLLITRFRLPPFIATLGTMSLARGAAYTVTGGAPIYMLPKSFLAIASKIGPIPIPIFIMLAIFVIAFYILKYTRLGRYSYAIGGNETATVLSGINVNLYKVIVYVNLGICCAISSMILTARLDSAVPVSGDGYELDAIAAVIIGGTSMLGGEGKISGTLIGSLMMGIVSNGLNLLTVPQGPQRMVKGAIIIIAVIIDMHRKKTHDAA